MTGRSGHIWRVTLVATALMCLIAHRPPSGAGSASGAGSTSRGGPVSGATLTNRPAPHSEWGDLDGDGRPDEVVLQHLGQTSRIAILLTGPRQISPLQTDDAAATVIAVDIDGDGDLDLITASPSGSQLWVNDGHGVFKPARLAPWRTLLAAGTIEAITDAAPVAVSTSLPWFVDSLGNRPGLTIEHIRAPGRPVWFTSPERFSHQLRAPPASSALT